MTRVRVRNLRNAKLIGVLILLMRSAAIVAMFCCIVCSELVQMHCYFFLREISTVL